MGDSNADLRFAVFVDDTLREYGKSPAFRAALHAEEPGAPAGARGICPPEHRHGDTPTCYGDHGCRCSGCRSASSERQKRNRMRRAQAEWQRVNNERKTA